jgi:DNA-binding XRE family transcriptional regulator
VPFRVYRPHPRRRHAMVAYRAKANLSQVEAAEKAGISQPSWHYIETGERNPSIGVAKKIAKLTGISVLRMLGLRPERRSSPRRTRAA